MHLGHGASACAMRNGQRVASSMGFAALDGLIVGSRFGALDRSVVLYLIEPQGINLQTVEHLRYQQSGIHDVSGLSADMRV